MSAPSAQTHHAHSAHGLDPHFSIYNDPEGDFGYRTGDPEDYLEDHCEPALSPVHWIGNTEWFAALSTPLELKVEAHISSNKPRKAIPSRIVHGYVEVNGTKVPVALDLVDAQLLIRKDGKLSPWEDCPVRGTNFQPQDQRLVGINLLTIINGQADPGYSYQSAVQDCLNHWARLLATEPRKWRPCAYVPVPKLPQIYWD